MAYDVNQGSSTRGPRALLKLLMRPALSERLKTPAVNNHIGAEESVSTVTEYYLDVTSSILDTFLNCVLCVR
jgi:hypothetical protein